MSIPDVENNEIDTLRKMSHRSPKTHRTQGRRDGQSLTTQAQTGDRSPTTHTTQPHTGDQCVAHPTDGLSDQCVKEANNDTTICCTTETIDHPSTAGIQPHLNDQSISSTCGIQPQPNDQPLLTRGTQPQFNDQPTFSLKPTPLICQPSLSPPPQPASVGLGNLPSSSGLSDLLTTIHTKLTQSRRPLIEGDILLSELYNPAKFPQLHMLANEPKDSKAPPKQPPKQPPKDQSKEPPKDPSKEPPKDPSKEPPNDPNAPKDAKDAKEPKERTSTHSHHKHKTYMDLRAMKKIKPQSKASSRSSSKSSRSSSQTSISISGECVGISESSLDNSLSPQSPQSPQSPFGQLSRSITSIKPCSDTSLNKEDPDPVNVVNIFPESKTSVQASVQASGEASGKTSPKKRGLSARLLCCRRIRGKSQSPDLESKVNTLRRTTMSNKAILETLDQDDVNDELEVRLGGVSEKK